MKPYYQDESVTLYHGDCRDVLPRLEDLGFDVAIADPPYGQTALAWDKWPIGWLGVVADVTSSLWCFGSVRMFWNHADEFDAMDWRLSQDVVWEKHNGSGFQVDRFRRIHESACHFYRGDWESVYHDVPRVQRTGERKTVRRRGQTTHLGAIGAVGYDDDGLRLMPSIIYAPSMHGNVDNETQKPESLVASLVDYACPSAGVLLAPFAGSGTDLVVAKRTGRKAVGVEMREEQCEKAARRLSQGALTEMFQ